MSEHRKDSTRTDAKPSYLFLDWEKASPKHETKDFATRPSMFCDLKSLISNPCLSPSGFLKARTFLDPTDTRNLQTMTFEVKNAKTPRQTEKTCPKSGFLGPGIFPTSFFGSYVFDVDPIGSDESVIRSSSRSVYVGFARLQWL